MSTKSLDRLIDITGLLVDERIGIIRHVREVPREAGDPDFYHFAALACNTEAFSRQANFRNAGGASTDRDTCIAKAIGEAVERYSAALFEVEELPLFAYEEAPFSCVAPAQFALYSASQYADPGFPWVPFVEETPVRWAPAFDLLTGERVHVPAAMVYVPYLYYQGSEDSPVVQPISTGLACHGSFEEAAAGGICEVIERDAFTITWQARLSHPQIRVETLNDRNYDLVDRFERTGANVTMLDLTMDARVPTILSVLRSRAERAPALVLAAASDLDPNEAARKSLEELAHTRRYSREVKARLPRLEMDPPHLNVIDQKDHLNFWCDEANVPLADFLFASRRRVEFDSIPNDATGNPRRDLATLLRKIGDTGHRVLVADITSPDVRELGLHVVRAVIPGYHPLFMSHRLRALGGRRLWETPQQLGYEGLDPNAGDNPAPHPYP